MDLFHGPGENPALSASDTRQPAVSQDTSTISGTIQPTGSSPTAGKSMVYVYRDGNQHGWAQYDRMFLNDDYFAALHRSEYVQREVPPGTVVFAAVAKSKVTPVALDAALLTNLHK
jgi:hypothetical protein